MCKKAIRGSLLFFTVLLLSTHYLYADATGPSVDWDEFGKNIEKALMTPNAGLQKSALKLYLKYNDKLNVDNAVFHVIGIYANQNDKEAKELALTSLCYIDCKEGNCFLRAVLDLECDPALRKKLTELMYARQ